MIINKKYILYLILFILICLSAFIFRKDFFYFDCIYFEEFFSNGCFAGQQIKLEIELKLYLISTLLIFALVLIYFLFSKTEKNFFPIFYIIMTYYFLSYFFYFFLTPDTQFVELNRSQIPVFEQNTSIYNITFSSKVFLIGLILFNLGYFVLNFLNINNQLKLDFLNSFLKIKDSNELFILTLTINFITICLFYFINIGDIFVQLKQLKFIFVYLCIGLNIFFYLKLKNNLKYILLLLIFFLILIEFFNATITVPFMMVLYVYFLFFSIKRKFFIIPILLVFLLALFYSSIKDDYRKILLGVYKIDNKTYLNKEETFYKAKVFIYVSKNKFLELKNLKDLKKYNFESILFKRIFHSGRSLLIVTAKTPETVPYFNGETYKLLFAKLIPRLFWKDKPNDELGNEIGKKYQVLSQDDFVTSWNMPVLNEFYINYGIKGIIFGMFLLGNLFYILTRFFPINNNQSYYLIIGSVIIYPLFNLESHLSQSFGNTITSFIFMAILIFLIKKIVLIFNLKLIKETS